MTALALTTGKEVRSRTVNRRRMFFSHTDGLKKYKELYLQLENISFYIHIKELPLKFIIIIIYRLFCIFLIAPLPPVIYLIIMYWESARQAAVVSCWWEKRPGELHTFTSRGRNALSRFSSNRQKKWDVKVEARKKNKNPLQEILSYNQIQDVVLVNIFNYQPVVQSHRSFWWVRPPCPLLKPPLTPAPPPSRSR